MRRRAVVRVVLLVTLMSVIAGQAWARIIRVDWRAAGGPATGQSWDNAFRTIQAAIDAAAAGDEVWVANGSYSENIVTKDNVALYGGFDNTMTNRSQRSWTTLVTTIDGGGRPGSVVTVPGSAGSLTRIDGFTIRGGSGRPVNGTGLAGGGIFCEAASVPTIANSTITENRLAPGTGNWSSGAGIYADMSTSTRIENNRISGNSAEGYGQGGGIFIHYYSYPTIDNNTIEGNSSSAYGGGIYIADGCTATVTRNTIRGNALTAGGRGAGLYAQQNTVSLSRNLIEGNAGTYYGGGIAFQIVNATIANNRITANSAGNGGGIYLYQTGGSIINNVIDNNSAGIGAGIHVNPYSNPLIANNTIVYNQTPSGHGSGAGIYFETLYYTPRVSNNIVAFNSSGLDGGEGGIWALPILDRNNVYGNLDGNYWAIDPRNPESGDISADPQFIPGTWQLKRIAGYNPCVDAGDNAVVALDNTGKPLYPDFDGEARIQKGIAAAPFASVDIGADEIDGRAPSTGLMSLAGTAGTNGWFRSAVTITLSASDAWYDNTMAAMFPGTGVDNTEYSFDGTTWTTYAGPIAFASNGQWVFDYRSTDKAGNVEVSRQTTFKIDTLAPSVASTVPVNNATGVSRTAVLKVNFSEAVAAGSAYGSITLKKGTTAVAFTKSISGNVLTITPSSRMNANANYTLTVPAAAVADVAGNPTTSAKVLAFKTGSN